MAGPGFQLYATAQQEGCSANNAAKHRKIRIKFGDRPGRLHPHDEGRDSGQRSVPVEQQTAGQETCHRNGVARRFQKERSTMTPTPRCQENFERKSSAFLSRLSASYLDQDRPGLFPETADSRKRKEGIRSRMVAELWARSEISMQEYTRRGNRIIMDRAISNVQNGE